MVLVFYPGDDTPVCTKQLNSYNNDLDEFDDVGAQVLAISAQSVASHDKFSGKHGFKFPLLADPDKAVAAAVRHARPARLSASQRVRGRCEGHHALRAPRDRRSHLPTGQRADRSGTSGRISRLSSRPVLAAVTRV